MLLLLAASASLPVAYTREHRYALRYRARLLPAAPRVRLLAAAPRMRRFVVDK